MFFLVLFLIRIYFSTFDSKQKENNGTFIYRMKDKEEFTKRESVYLQVMFEVVKGWQQGAHQKPLIDLTGHVTGASTNRVTVPGHTCQVCAY